MGTIQCPQCGKRSDEGVDFCPECDTFLPWTDADAVTRPTAGINLSVSETHLDVTPGAEASLEVRIRNTGRNVDRIDLAIKGTPEGWAVVEPGTHSLLPGTAATARLTVRPPRDPSVPAGQHLLELHARSTIDSRVDSQQHVSVDVAPFDDLRIVMTPPTSRGTTTALHRVVVENGGNHAMTVSLHGRDGAGDVSVALEPSVVDVDRGASEAVTATVSPVRPLDDGPARPRPFTVVANGATTESTLDGVMLQEPVAASPEAPPPPPPAPEPAPTPPPAAPTERRPRRWPWVLLVLLLLGGAAGVLAALDPFELFDDDPDEASTDDDAGQGAAGADEGDDGNAQGAAPELPDLDLVAAECTLVPDAGELRLAIQITNLGAPVDDPVAVTAASGDFNSSTEITVDGTATADLTIPIDPNIGPGDLPFTIAVDPGNEVEEPDEDNNTGVVTVTLPSEPDEPVSVC